MKAAWEAEVNKDSFRFAVLDADGNVRSDVWKVVETKQGHLMIGNSRMGDFKFTIHAPKDGLLGCHLAWNSPDKIPAEMPDGRRAFQRWERMASEFKVAKPILSINFPGTFLAAARPSNKPIDVKLPAPKPEFIMELVVMYSLTSTLEGVFPKNILPIAHIDLSTGENVTIVGLIRPCLDEIILDRVDQLYPEKSFDSFPQDIEARLTITDEPDHTGCVKAIEVGGPVLRGMLSKRWGLP